MSTGRPEARPFEEEASAGPAEGKARGEEGVEKKRKGGSAVVWTPARIDRYPEQSLNNKRSIRYGRIVDLHTETEELYMSCVEIHIIYLSTRPVLVRHERRVATWSCPALYLFIRGRAARPSPALRRVWPAPHHPPRGRKGGGGRRH
jgi:hypothetical protein